MSRKQINEPAMRRFFCRSSMTGKIMTESRSKSNSLSVTCTSYLKEWLKSQIYGQTKQIIKPVIQKGHLVEDDAIEFLNPEYSKNEQFFENDFIRGTPDIITDDKIIDIKCSWDIWTFPLLESNNMYKHNKDYWWQMQSYMWLTGRKRAEVTYVLMPTPPHLNYDIDETDFIESLPREHRIKTFAVDYDEGTPAVLSQKVEDCNEWLFNNYKEFML